MWYQRFNSTLLSSYMFWAPLSWPLPSGGDSGLEILSVQLINSYVILNSIVSSIIYSAGKNILILSIWVVDNCILRFSKLIFIFKNASC